MNKYSQTFQPHFRQTDSAGVLFFNETFNIFHDVYEGWAESVLGSKKDWFENSEWAVPIKKVSGDFRRPLIAFEPCEVQISLKSVGETSFQLETEIKQKGSVCCTIESVHVFINKQTRTPLGIPAAIRAKFS